MASKSICTRCLRAASTTSPTQLGKATIRRAFISTATPSQQHPKTRKLHQSTRNKANPAFESSGQPTQEIPPISGIKPTNSKNDSSRLLLQPNNLFHSFTNSPSPAIRKRAAFMRQNAYCPHPEHQATRAPTSPHDLEARKTGATPPAHVRYECPDCGIPVSCSEEHFVDDYESHLEICDLLREINEDDHDLHSGRFFTEFEYPSASMEEAQANMTNWDTLLYSREFTAINDARRMRQVTRLLTYPITIGSILHELSPYNLKDRLLPEGLRSLSALRYTLHPPRSGAGIDVKGLRPNPPPVRLFILGARAESSLPREVWLQLAYLFPRATFHLHFIGPESMTNRDDEYPLPDRTPSNPFGAIVEDRLGGAVKISTYVEYFHTLHEAQHFAPYDPYFDAFVMFHPGLGHPASSHEWASTLPQLLETKVPVICTGYTDFDMQRDIEWAKKEAGGEMDIILEPGENRFRSLRWDMNDLDPGDVSCGNWGVWGFRGKRYETDAYTGKAGE
ncbi:mRNA processing protein (Mss51) [Zymoseptoria brevis]|uniref:mRNA processing protein (Mss51) n=1 Tax=Zymoseptoria brevis TaxID=1047168 RepID=A0A0F4GZ31_9PEZI|nr:mRNA processing protein (Mss51) [Zymoseptoria brevis]